MGGNGSCNHPDLSIVIGSLFFVIFHLLLRFVARSVGSDRFEYSNQIGLFLWLSSRTLYEIVAGG